MVRGQVIAEFLDQVVTEGVQDQVQEEIVDVFEDEVSHLVRFLRGFQFSLQESAPVLVGGQLDVVQFLQWDGMQIIDGCYC